MSPQVDGVVRAAGAIPWRPAPGGGLEVLLVHSARYDEWSWPKGKPDRLEDGGVEPLPVAAVREVAEETGVTVRLGQPLPEVGYEMPDGRHKRVSYWVGRPVSEGPRTAAAEEIDATAWLPVEEARARLTRPGDQPPLHHLLELDGRGRLDTGALVVVRHVKAVPRKKWDGDDADRPANAAGEAQAGALVPLLRSWRPERLLTSPWTRCVQTLTPYAQQHGTALDPVPELTEDAALEDPEGAAAVVRRLLDSGLDVAVCTHRPVLGVIIGELRGATATKAGSALPRRNPWLVKGELLVAHVDRQPTEGKHLIHALERHRPG